MGDGANPSSANMQAPKFLAQAWRRAILISRASADRNSGNTYRPTSTDRPWADNWISDLPPFLGSTRTQSRLNSARCSLPPLSSSTTSRDPSSEIRSPSDACREESQNDPPTATSTSPTKGRTSTAPGDQITAPIPSDTRHSYRYNPPRSAGDTEQLRRKNHWMF